jgi:acetyl esterase/lipase
MNVMSIKDSHRWMDPELAQALAAVPMGPAGVFDLTDIEGTRAGGRAFAEAIAATLPEVPGVTVTEIHVPRPDGGAGPDIPVVLLRPQNTTGPLPVIMWFHGGGQVVGFAAQDTAWLKQLCVDLGCAVASVEYRLAPETRAPGAAEDGDAVFRWITENPASGQLGLDRSRVGLAGQSGGGGVAVATALLIRDRAVNSTPGTRGPVAPLFQMLMYPMLDDRNTTASSREITDIGIWDRATNLLAWQAIIGDTVGAGRVAEDVSAYCAPARARDLTGLPATFIAVGELDVFRDEDLDFAARLREARVPVEQHLYPGAFHAFDLFAPQARISQSFHHTWNSYLARQLTPAGAETTASTDTA